MSRGSRPSATTRNGPAASSPSMTSDQCEPYRISFSPTWTPRAASGARTPFDEAARRNLGLDVVEAGPAEVEARGRPHAASVGRMQVHAAEEGRLAEDERPGQLGEQLGQQRRAGPPHGGDEDQRMPLPHGPGGRPRADRASPRAGRSGPGRRAA